jgi:hypothetical protein
MPVVLGGVFGLRLGAQHDLVDEEAVLRVADAFEDAIEKRGFERPLLWQFQSDRRQNLAERPHLLERGLVVNPVDQVGARLLQSLGGSDVGEDHEFLDQPVRVETLGHEDAVDGAVVLEKDLALGEIEKERLADVTRLLHATVGGPERPEDGVEDRLGRLVRAPVDRGLRLLIGQLGRGAHHHAMKAVPSLTALRVDHEANGKGRPVLVRT